MREEPRSVEAIGVIDAQALAVTVPLKLSGAKTTRRTVIDGAPTIDQNGNGLM